MLPKVVAVIAASWCLCGSVNAQKADTEIGVLTCALEAPHAPNSGPVSDSQVRDALCTFKPKQGSEETYDGTVEGMSLSADARTTMIWVVKTDTVVPSAPGLLQQSYAVDRNALADQGPMIGETNSRISLQSMTDKREGAASATQKPTGYVIIGLKLKLRSAAG
jgi:hypothetical protein